METYGKRGPALSIIEIIEAIKYNAGMYIELGESAFKFKGLTAEDRAAIQLAIGNLKTGLRFIDCTTPDELRDAAFRLMVGAEQIGERCTVCDSEKEYWRRESCRKGGKKTSPDTQKWKDWATAIIEKNPEVKASKMTESLLAEKSKPSNLPGYDFLIKFVRPTRKRIAAKKGRPVRLVRSA
jgi:hypothetical protein